MRDVGQELSVFYRLLMYANVACRSWETGLRLRSASACIMPELSPGPTESYSKSLSFQTDSVTTLNSTSSAAEIIPTQYASHPKTWVQSWIIIISIWWWIDIHCAEHFIAIISLDSHNNPMRLCDSQEVETESGSGFCLWSTELVNANSAQRN